MGTEHTALTTSPRHAAIQRRTYRRRLVGWSVLALTPVLSLGFLVGLPSVVTAARIRSRFQIGFAVVCCAAMAEFWTVAGSNLPDSSWVVNLSFGCVWTLSALATVNALMVRRQVVLGRAIGPNDDPLSQAKHTLSRRDEARRILAADPRLADQLAIGRPDVPHRFDDGGLIDVNHVPASALARAPGIDHELADRIVSTRDGVGGFGSLDDLSVTLGLEPRLLDAAADVLIFRR